eukprot:2521981-Amphidinium_carterae.1
MRTQYVHTITATYLTKRASLRATVPCPPTLLPGQPCLTRPMRFMFHATTHRACIHKHGHEHAFTGPCLAQSITKTGPRQLVLQENGTDRCYRNIHDMHDCS